MSDKYQPGDRVRLNEKGQAIWPEFTGGVITEKKIGESGAGYVGREGYAWGVRFDEYGERNYGTPENCHIASESVLVPEVSAEDVEAAIQSILRGAS